MCRWNSNDSISIRVHDMLKLISLQLSVQSQFSECPVTFIYPCTKKPQAHICRNLPALLSMDYSGFTRRELGMSLVPPTSFVEGNMLVLSRDLYGCIHVSPAVS